MHVRKHQTLLAVYVADENYNYKSRASRLTNSVNREDTIKVDHCLVTQDGRIFTGSPFAVDIEEKEPEDETSLSEFAHKHDYVMVLQVSPATEVPPMPEQDEEPPHTEIL